MIDYQTEISRHIERLYPSIYKKTQTLPKAFTGSDKVKIIVLGADPSYISEDIEFKYVFGLEDPKSPFFRGILKNLNLLNLELKDIYVQNVVRNYFLVETSNNKDWIDIATFWIDHLKCELDSKFDRSIPVLITAWKILKALVGRPILSNYTAHSIYDKKVTFKPSENILARDIIPFFRHPKYRIEKWPAYNKKIKKLSGRIKYGTI